MQIFTYVVIGLGFTLFFSGLIGWVGGASESPCLVRLFLFSIVLSLIAEIGGIISLNIVRIEVRKQVQRSNFARIYTPLTGLCTSQLDFSISRITNIFLLPLKNMQHIRIPAYLSSDLIQKIFALEVQRKGHIQVHLGG